MKKLIILFVLFISAGFILNTVAQGKTKIADTKKAVTVSGISKTELNDRADTWLKSYFSSENDKILNRKNELIDGNLVVTTDVKSKLTGTPIDVQYTIKFVISEGTYTYEVKNMTYVPEYSVFIERFQLHITANIEHGMADSHKTAK